MLSFEGKEKEDQGISNRAFCIFDCRIIYKPSHQTTDARITLHEGHVVAFLTLTVFIVRDSVFTTCYL